MDVIFRHRGTKCTPGCVIRSLNLVAIVIQVKNWEITQSNSKTGKNDRFLKHSKCDTHTTSMVKWTSHLAQTKVNLSVLDLMESNHKKLIAKNREYLRIIIALLNRLPQRGHEEFRSNLDTTSDINRWNLHHRCKDSPWLGDMLGSKLGTHTQWTSSTTQNELLEILSMFVHFEVVRKSGEFAVIMDETSDISRSEQVSICLSYVVNGEKRETFIRFFRVKSTTGEALCELLCNVMRDMNPDRSKIVAACFDGASNKKGEHKGVATRMKETSPMSLYIHCYGQPSIKRYARRSNTFAKYFWSHSVFIQLPGSKPKAACFFRRLQDEVTECDTVIMSLGSCKGCIRAIRAHNRLSLAAV